MSSSNGADAVAPEVYSEENDAALAAAIAASEAEAAAAGITIPDPNDFRPVAPGAPPPSGGDGSSSPDQPAGGPGGPNLDPSRTAVRLSSPWSTDDSYTSCAACSSTFGPLNRRHHCRLCGRIFCDACTSGRCLIPPSSIVLVPRGGGGWGGKVVKRDDLERQRNRATFEERGEGDDREITYLRDDKASSAAADGEASASASAAEGGSAAGAAAADAAPSSIVPPDTLLYGRGLEERAKLAREPLRVCDGCRDRLEPVQERLRLSNANAMRYNNIDPTDMRRLFNSPLAFTLGHEVRKAAYTLNNLLPLPKKMGAFVSSAPSYGVPEYHDPTLSGAYAIGNQHSAVENCKDTCTAVQSNLGDLDGVRIPARLLEKARGVAVLTVVKGGLGFAGFEFGTGLVVARLPDGRGWSPPSAVGLAGVAWGALVGAQVSDHVFLLMTDKAVELMSADDASFQLGADVGVAVGPLGRTVEADLGAAAAAATDSDQRGGVAVSPIYTYSLSKGLYAGASLDGKVMVTRHRVNEKFYGYQVRARDLLNGEVPTPPAAQPLYDALKRCHVYATTADGGTRGNVGGGGGYGGSGATAGVGGGGVGPGSRSMPMGNQLLPPGVDPSRMNDMGFGGSFRAYPAPAGADGGATMGSMNGAALAPPATASGRQDQSIFAPPEETRFGGMH